MIETSFKEIESIDNGNLSASLISDLTKIIEYLLESKALKYYENVLNIVQVLAISNCYSCEQLINTVVLISSSIYNFTNETDLIKILQLLLIILNPDIVTKESLCSSVYTICYYSFNTKNLLFWNIAISVLRQMYTLLFPLLSDQNPKLIPICLHQLENLAELMHNKHKYMQAIGIDFLFLIFKNYTKEIALIKTEDYIKNLNEKLLLHLNDPMIEMSLLIKIVKFVTSAIQLSSKFCELLVPVFGWASSSSVLKKYLLLEVLKELLSSFEVLVTLGENSVDSSKAHPLQEIIWRMLKIKKMTIKLQRRNNVKPLSILDSVKTLGDISDSLLYKKSIIYREHMNQMLIKVLYELTKTIQDIFALEYISSNKSFSSRQIEVIISSLKDVWSELCELFMSLLNEAQNEEEVQETLNVAQNLIEIAGKLKLTPQMNEVLKKLCELSLPLHFGISFS